jgi:phospholipase D1/2
VICGSANLNDRSQMGDRDSEIAVIIQDPHQINSYMDGRPYQASVYASSLRRQIFRKHLGLLPHQDPARPDVNFTPVELDANYYDFGTHEDRLVEDPLSSHFNQLWNRTARANTDVFTRAFHAIPCDGVHTWEDYDRFYGDLFVPKKDGNGKEIKAAKYQYGHVVKEEFRDVWELKQLLNTVRGNLVEMPLRFMDEVDFAVENLSFNGFTDVIYT